MALHPDMPPDVDAIETYGGCWPTDTPFPLTANECLAIMMGYSVRPAAGPLSEKAFFAMPGKIEVERDDRVVLWRT